ncbi:hypothetical protein R1sor_000431 [Riccia sorocarpa]|uniref:Uncharacterized protein n=1 Tax=Riccia sorocarpa TaxID=122646 RepID=A0ABD3GVK6_9MARC
MATSSIGDKGKVPMVEQEDIGTEEGELLDVHPPLPEPVGRSGSDRKRKKPAREEEGIDGLFGSHKKPTIRPHWSRDFLLRDPYEEFRISGRI